MPAVFFVRTESKGLAEADCVRTDSKGFKAVCLPILTLDFVKAVNKGLADLLVGIEADVADVPTREGSCSADFTNDSSPFRLPCQ